MGVEKDIEIACWSGVRSPHKVGPLPSSNVSDLAQGQVRDQKNHHMVVVDLEPDQSRKLTLPHLFLVPH